MIVDAEYLQHAGIAEEGAGALAIGGAELVNALQDRPKLHPVASHQAHSLLDRSRVAQGEQVSPVPVVQYVSRGDGCPAPHQSAHVGNPFRSNVAVADTTSDDVGECCGTNPATPHCCQQLDVTGDGVLAPVLLTVKLGQAVSFACGPPATGVAVTV